MRKKKEWFTSMEDEGGEGECCCESGDGHGLGRSLAGRERERPDYDKRISMSGAMRGVSLHVTCAFASFAECDEA